MSFRVLLASCAAHPQGDGDEEGLIGLLAEHGVSARWAPWGSPVGADERVVLRAAWDYPDRRGDFLAWCASVPRLANPYRVVSVNTDKRYLARLQQAGLPVIPTLIHDVGATLTVPADEADEFVIKSVIGAGSRGAGRFSSATLNLAVAHLDSLYRSGQAAIVQPYQHAVDTVGETALIFINGTYSHAFTKGPMLGGGVVDTGGDVYAVEQLGDAAPQPTMVATARECLAGAAEDAGVTIDELLYARVDLVPGNDGRSLVLEIELTEPSLGFRFGGPAALARFAAAIAAFAA